MPPDVSQRDPGGHYATPPPCFQSQGPALSVCLVGSVGIALVGGKRELKHAVTHVEQEAAAA